jgi:hypothetical protein
MSYVPSQGEDIRRCKTRSPRQEVRGEEEEDDKNEKFHASRFSLKYFYLVSRPWRRSTKKIPSLKKGQTEEKTV